MIRVRNRAIRHRPFGECSRAAIRLPRALGSSAQVGFGAVSTTDSEMPRARQDWRWLVAVFFVTSLVESLGVSQIFVLLPAYLPGMAVDDQDRLRIVGI